MNIIRQKKLVIIVIALLLAASCLVGTTRAQEEYDPSVFTPNGVVYRLRGSFYLLVKSTNMRPPYHELRKGNFTFIMSIFSRDQGNGYYAWSFSICLERWYYNRPEDIPRALTVILESLGIRGIAVPPLIAVKWGTREAYFLIDFHELRRALKEARPAGPESIGEIALRVLVAVGQVNKEIYFTNPFYIPINVGLGTELVYGVYNRTSGSGYEARLIINGEDDVEVAGKSYPAWVMRLNVKDVSSLLAKLGVREDIVRAARSMDLEVSIYYDKVSGWLLRYETHGHLANNTWIKLDGKPVKVRITGDVDIVMELVEPGTVNIGGKSLVERELGLPREATLVLGVLIMALVAAWAFLRPEGGG